MRGTGLYYEDFNVGDEFVTPARTITEADVTAFAGLSGDYNPLHTDAEFAKTAPFGERIAHGLLGLSVSTGLSSRLGILDGTAVAFLGMEWRFTGPIRIGDTIHSTLRVKFKRETKKEDRGIVEFECRIVNQKGETAQEGVRTIMVRRRTGGEETA